MRSYLIPMFMFFTTGVLSAQTITDEIVLQKIATGQPFVMVFLKNGDASPEADSLMNDMQMEHLRRLFTLEQEGKISVFGPITNDKIYKGIIIFNGSDKKAVTDELQKDPYIKNGHLTYDLYDFFCIPGQRI